jgi:hypothetical protein
VGVGGPRGLAVQELQVMSVCLPLEEAAWGWAGCCKGALAATGICIAGMPHGAAVLGAAAGAARCAELAHAAAADA